MNSNRLSRRVASMALLVSGLVILLPCIALAQDGASIQFDSEDATAALEKFTSAEQNLVEKKNAKESSIATIFAETHQKLRDQLVAELKESLAAETKSGNLDKALEIRGAIQYFENMHVDPVDVRTSISIVTLAAANKKLLERIESMEAKLGTESPTISKPTTSKPTTTNKLGMQLCLIPAGEFRMGSETSIEELAKIYRSNPPRFYDNSFPVHKVRISKPFYMGAHEVTVGQFRKFVTVTKYQTVAEKDSQGGIGYVGQNGFQRNVEFSWKNTGFKQEANQPVVNITWIDAVEFCKWLSEHEGAEYQLPTEAQWEYACRAGTTTMFYTGSKAGEAGLVANSADATLKINVPSIHCSRKTDGWAFTSPVGQFPANPFGLYDMYGNATEWCRDRYSKSYSPSTKTDPIGPLGGKLRVARGGGWKGSNLSNRSAARSGFNPDYVGVGFGFRVVRAVDK